MLLILLFEGIAILLGRRWLAHSLVRLIRVLGGSPSIAVWFYSVLTLPGILVHEIAHFFVAALVGLRTGAIELLPTLTPDGGVELGSVQVEKKDPIRLALVGLAPLLFGIPILLWLTTLVTPINTGDAIDVGSLVRNWLQFPHTVLLYLLTSITLHMFPSRRDMNTWPVAGLFIMVVIWGLWILGISWFRVSLWPTTLQALILPLATGLALTLSIVVFFFLFIKALTMIIALTTLYNK